MDKTQMKARIKLVEAALMKELDVNGGALSPNLTASMKYSLNAGGKRIRPILIMAAADAVGGHGEDYLQVACAMEMIHTYSLIHDDLPAMDNDDYRRGKLTNHKVYGEAMAILAGDGLLTQAFEVICRQKGVTPQQLVRVISEIAIAAGPMGMVGGQVVDMESEGHRIPMEELKRMHMGKTGALIRASIRCGAILGGADEKQLADLTTYAEQFGLAFQITDDILDVVGDEAVIGKPVGSDERNEKSTYVTLTSLDTAKELAAEAVRTATDALEGFGDRATFLRELAEYLLTRNK